MSAPANRTKGVLEQLGTFHGVPIPWQIVLTKMNISIFSCIAANRYDAIILIGRNSVKIANPLTIFGISSGKIQPSRKNNSVQLGQNFQNPLPDNLAESAKLTSVQLWQKQKIATSMQLAEK